jgi:hypothetical protein
MTKRLNRQIILYNLSEAREQLQEVEAQIKNKQRLSEVELQIMLEHAYHHLNVAWNARHEKLARYRTLKDEDFNQWRKYPKEIKTYNIPIKRKK